MYNAPKVYTSILVTDTLKITEPFGLQWWITIEQWLINCSFMKSSHKLSSCSPSISSSVHSDLITRMDFFLHAKQLFIFTSVRKHSMKTVSLDYGHSVTARYKMPIYPSENLWFLHWYTFSLATRGHQLVSKLLWLIPQKVKACFALNIYCLSTSDRATWWSGNPLQPQAPPEGHIWLFSC